MYIYIFESSYIYIGGGGGGGDYSGKPLFRNSRKGSSSVCDAPWRHAADSSQVLRLYEGSIRALLSLY